MYVVRILGYVRQFPRHEDLWDLHGRREERVRCHAEELVGVGFIFPGVHGDPPVQHLHAALAVCGAQAAWGKEMRGWRLWGCRGRLRAEHLQELVLDSRKQSDIEKEEHVLHAAKQAG